MKVLFVGDVHNHTYMFDDIERLDKEYNFDRIIFLGDYVDDWETTNKESIDTLNTVFRLKNNNPDKYTFCIGNHELSYMGYPCSGHQYSLGDVVEELLKNNMNLLDFYAEVTLGNRIFICTHSGITNDYALNELDRYGDCIKVLEEMNKNKKMYLSLLTHCSMYRGGNSLYSSFVWADKRELYNVGENGDRYVIPYQIVGHSPVKTATRILPKNNEELWFLDTHSTYRDGSEFGDKSYLVWDEVEFKVVY